MVIPPQVSADTSWCRFLLLLLRENIVIPACVCVYVRARAYVSE